MRIIPNSFTKYDLSEDEILRGKLLAPETVAVIQNLISTIAEQKIMLKFTPDNISTYTQQEAEMQGQILILQQLLSDAEDARLVVNKLATQTQS